MTLRNCLNFLELLFLFVCFIATKSNAQQTNPFDGYPTVKEALNKKVWTSNKSYYLITKSTDTTVHLFWGNDNMKRMFNEDLELWAAERLFKKWTSREYLILEYWTGSGVWLDLVLPLNKKEKVQEFGNGLCFDSINNLLGVQQSGDTILLVQNLRTNKNQYIIDREHHCKAALNSSCIDTVAIENKLLYLKWDTPNNFDKKKKVYKKTIRLDL